MKKNKEINKFEEKIIELEAEIGELKLGWQRTQADFENFRKRSEEQKKSLIEYANTDFVSDVLPVIDNFQRSTHHIPEEIMDNNWVRGMEFIEKQLLDVLKTHGAELIEVKIGDQFNPTLHEAIVCDTCEGFKPDQITEIMENGYRLGEKILRPVKVKVAK